MAENNEYDVIIIGAGIGGLVCGCYLAKAGMKVLIVEQHSKPGGYCSSFRRKGFLFDSCIHYLKFEEGKSFISKLIKDFQLKKYVSFKKLEISDLIVTPAGEFYVNSDVKKTIHNLISLFPAEGKNIESFFNFLNTKDGFLLSAKTRNRNLSEVMHKYFKDKELISIFNSLLMNIGLPIDKVSAIKAYFFFKEFFLNQSHYPLGGMQKFSNALAKAFLDFGGLMLYSTYVDQIMIKNKRSKGIKYANNTISSKYIVSNVDPAQTFLQLVGIDNMSEEMIKKVNSIIPSVSAFMVYIGLDNNLETRYSIKNSLWYFPSATFNQIYKNIEKKESIVNDNYLICSFPSSYDRSLALNDGVTMAIFSGANFGDESYWNKRKDEYANIIIKRAQSIIPNIINCQKVLSIATPHTLFRYTRNFHGACYGLASVNEQIDRYFMTQKTEIENLYMAGHWTTHGIGQGGVSMVAFSGASASKYILKKQNRKLA